MNHPTRRQTLALAAATVLSPAALAQQAAPFKVGLILPLTGPFTATGLHLPAGASSSSSRTTGAWPTTPAAWRRS
jgi:hypothetical protein